MVRIEEFSEEHETETVGAKMTTDSLHPQVRTGRETKKERDRDRDREKEDKYECAGCLKVV